MLNLQTLPILLFWCLLAAVCLCAQAEIAEAEAAALKLELPIHDCTKPDEGSRRHVEWIKKLNGRRIVFLGDSPLRFQYLALGYYLAHGSCPDTQKPEQPGHILSEQSFETWNQFFQQTSAALVARNDAFRTTEVCMCSRMAKEPMQVTEQRTFTYQDVQGRRVELVYLQYLTEAFQPLTAVLATADSYEPTDVIISFGEELKQTDTQCGMTPENTESCPYLPWFCWYLKADHHPFRVWWMPAMPTSVDGQIVDNWYTSHLNLYHRCVLDASQVIDRRAVIRTLQPNETLRKDLWSSTIHLDANTNHAFNWQLLRRLDERSNVTLPASGHSSRMWKQIFASQKL